MQIYSPGLSKGLPKGARTLPAAHHHQYTSDPISDVYFGRNTEKTKVLSRTAKTAIAVSVAGGVTFLAVPVAAQIPDDVRTSSPAIVQEIMDEDNLEQVGWLCTAFALLLMTSGAIDVARKIEQPWMSTGNRLNLLLATALIFDQSLVLRSMALVAGAVNYFAQYYHLKNQQNPLNRQSFSTEPLRTTYSKANIRRVLGPDATESQIKSVYGAVQLALRGDPQAKEVLATLNKEFGKEFKALLAYMGKNAGDALSTKPWKELRDARKQPDFWRTPQGSVMAISSQASMISAAASLLAFGLGKTDGLGFIPNVELLTTGLSGGAQFWAVASLSMSMYPVAVRAWQHRKDEGKLTLASIPPLVIGRALAATATAPMAVDISQGANLIGAAGWFVGGTLNAEKTRHITDYWDRLEQEANRKPALTALNVLRRFGWVEGSQASGYEATIIPHLKNRGAEELKIILETLDSIQRKEGVSLLEAIEILRPKIEASGIGGLQPAGMYFPHPEDISHWFERSFDSIFESIQRRKYHGNLIGIPTPSEFRAFLKYEGTTGLARMQAALDDANDFQFYERPAHQRGLPGGWESTFAAARATNYLAMSLHSALNSCNGGRKQIPMDLFDFEETARFRQMAETGVQALNDWIDKYESFARQIETENPDDSDYVMKAAGVVRRQKIEIDKLFRNIFHREDAQVREAQQALGNMVDKAGLELMRERLMVARKFMNVENLLNNLAVTSGEVVAFDLWKMLKDYALMQKHGIALEDEETVMLRQMVEIGMQVLSTWIILLENVNTRNDFSHTEIQKELNRLRFARLNVTEKYYTLFPNSGAKQVSPYRLRSMQDILLNVQDFRFSEPWTDSVQKAPGGISGEAFAEEASTEVVMALDETLDVYEKFITDPRVTGIDSSEVVMLKRILSVGIKALQTWENQYSNIYEIPGNQDSKDRILSKMRQLHRERIRILEREDKLRKISEMVII